MPKGLSLKGKTYEDIYGSERAHEKRKIQSKALKKNWKNATKEKRKYYAELAKAKIKAGKFGRKKGVKVGPRAKETILKIKDRNTTWKTKKQFVDVVKETIKNNKEIPLSLILENHHKYNLPSRRIIYKFFNSVDDLVDELNVDVIRHKPFNKSNISRIGKNEEKILGYIENEIGVSLERQHYVNGCYIDGYDKINNVAYEIDEKHHKLLSHQVKDTIRETKIKLSLSCDIVRIDESVAIKQVMNNQLIEMVK